MRNIMRRFSTALAAALALATPAAADPYCDALLSYIHDAPANAIPTIAGKDKSGPQTLAKLSLPGARCLVSPYNPTGVTKDHPAEQSVYCFWSASPENYRQSLDANNTRVAECMGQPVADDTFTTRTEYDSNLSFVRVSADQMTDDWAVSVTVMPQG